MYSILDRYVGKIIFCNMGIILFVLLSLSSVIKFVDELRKVGQGCYGIFEVVVYVFLGILRDIEIFFPMAVLLGGVLGFGILLVRNELILMEMFGFGRWRIVCSLLKTMFPVILFGMFINEWVVPVSERAARNYRYKMINNVSVYFYSNLWIKDRNDFVYIEKMIRSNELFGVHIYHFDKDKNLRSICYVRLARFFKNSWTLFDVNKWYFRNDMGIIEKESFDDKWLTFITPRYLLMTVMSLYYSTSLSVFDLYRCIYLFKQNGLNVGQYQLRFWKKIFFPMSVMVMLLTALSCILKKSLLYRLNFGFQLVISVIYGFFFMF